MPLELHLKSRIYFQITLIEINSSSLGTGLSVIRKNDLVDSHWFVHITKYTNDDMN